ncbi:hypothetical protein BJ322DRAFT_552634 [Thelephora terrestris]|uniref:Uncharacterized protein n=1 Tax=Thelephora terrestris TaxID=56493 RepID=A0A9P6HLK9_9AGAM|nr:hypothetical protein BJ322DRAFT_552634 [Thelephora terrestris]
MYQLPDPAVEAILNDHLCDVYQLADPAVEAILNEWHLQEYAPPNTDIQEWICTIETLCDTYGVPDTQRPQCATRFIKSELRNELENVLRDSRTQFGPVHWTQFVNFMVALDRKFREAWEALPFYKKYPKSTGAALGITGTVLMAPVAIVGAVLAPPVVIVGAITAVGSASVGVAAGILATTIQYVVYGDTQGGLFSLLQSAGATMVLPSVGTILSDSIACGPGPGGAGPPPYNQVNPDGYLLTLQALQAIVKSWHTPPYNPPGTGAAHWLSRQHHFCEEYGVPVKQQAQCAMHHMGDDCREAAYAAGCHDMSWDRFTTWLLKYDEIVRMSANSNYFCLPCQM